MENKTITTTLRMPEERNAYLKQKADEIGISQNALILMLLDIGIKSYEALGHSVQKGRWVIRKKGGEKHMRYHDEDPVTELGDQLIGETVRERQQAEEAEMAAYLVDVPTRLLVDELKKRDGVETYQIDPRGTVTATVQGPAILFVVID